MRRDPVTDRLDAAMQRVKELGDPNRQWSVLLRSVQLTHARRADPSIEDHTETPAIAVEQALAEERSDAGPNE